MAEGPGVEVHESLVHHGRTLGEVGPEAYPVGVTDTDSRWDHVIHHARELVHAQHCHRGVLRPRPQADAFQAGQRDRTQGRPHQIGEQGEDAVQVDRAGAHQPV